MSALSSLPHTLYSTWRLRLYHALSFYFLFFYDRERLDDQRLGWRSLIFRVYMYGVQRGRLIDSTNTLHSRIHCVCEDGLYIHVLFLHLH